MSAQQIILQRFGTPDEAYQSKYCELWEIQKDFPWAANIINSATGKPLQKVFINSLFKAKLHTAFADLEKAGVHTEIITWDGCYNQRSVRGMHTTSLHAWGMAVDLNAAKEKLAQQHTHWSTCFIAIMKAAGLFWGGDFKSRLDSMHFALYNG